jgi:nuclear receptor interaction protein
MPLERHEHFAYDFLKCILLWLDSGVGAVLREFTHDPDNPQMSYRKRRPVSLDADIDAIDFELLPYLLRLASETAVDDLDDESGQAYIFRTEVDAVNSLARAMRIPFADLAGEAAAERDTTGKPLSQDRETAVRFWAYRVGRAVLKNAAVDVTFSLVDTAFGEFMGARYGEEAAEESITTADADGSDDEADDSDNEDNDDDEEDEAMSDSASASTSEDDDTDDHVEGTFLLGAAAASRQARPKMTAGRHVPAITHTNLYRGHCNVETTKDVNFFGLQDEYVISGSDDGNFFIWEKKTGRLLNVLEGDGEVVNVVQGHPYEPIIAVSGIDSTVKIFGCDSRARKDAALGVGIEEIDRQGFSSIGLRNRRARQRRQRDIMDDMEVCISRLLNADMLN